VTDAADRHSEAWLEAALKGDGACPPLETLHEVAAGQAPADVDRTVRAHAEACAACRAEIRLATAAFAAEPSDEEAAAVERIAARLESASPVGAPSRKADVVVGPWRRFRVPLLAAAALIAVVVGTRVWEGSRPPALPPIVSEPTRGAALELRSPLGTVAGRPSALEWEPVDGASGYRVSIERVDGTTVWSAEAGTPPLAIPDDVARRLGGGVTYRWRVEALDAGSAVLASSQLGTFRIDSGSLEERPRG